MHEVLNAVRPGGPGVVQHVSVSKKCVQKVCELVLLVISGAGVLRLRDMVDLVSCST